MHQVRAVIAIVVAFLAATFPAAAEKRVALVIGNSAYAKTGRLANPAADAKAVADLFQRAGFEITEARLDLGLAAFKRALSDFEVAAQGADIAAFYFSGHGVLIGGQDYLLPVDAELARDVDAQDEAVTLERVLRATEGARHLRLVIVDACRDNPFVPLMQSLVATKSVTKGLAPPVEAANTLTAFAARAGTQAIDGAPGANSPFAAALLRHLAEPGLDVQLAFRKVRSDVLAATNGRQEPYTYGSLGEDSIPLIPARLPVPFQGLKPPSPLTCGVLEDQLQLTMSNTNLSRDRFQKAIGALHEIAQNVSDSCNLKKRLFGGPILEIHRCINKAIYLVVGAPRGGIFVWTERTQGPPPTDKGQWVLGVMGDDPVADREGGEGSAAPKPSKRPDGAVVATLDLPPGVDAAICLYSIAPIDVRAAAFVKAGR